MKVILSEIFIEKSSQSFYSKDELMTLEIKKEFIQRLARYYNISYISNSSKENTLCYANSSSVRFEYRSNFTKKDIIVYLRSTLKQDIFDIETENVTFR
ncbi:hypothetical protein [Flagellimonas profundi]|uniref:DUF4974 domain-containing protein n=1 Tax=Flagellimonas profundi TaxID=2915620 RepID=A0ABS3FAS8_9FLAO|nr:hypothetical protein [Allomuricauda profundi]MBO0340260.1 hypothetical protein [Allomuricauda profundi]